MTLKRIYSIKDSISVSFGGVRRFDAEQLAAYNLRRQQNFKIPPIAMPAIVFDSMYVSNLRTGSYLIVEFRVINRTRLDTTQDEFSPPQADFPLTLTVPMPVQWGELSGDYQTAWLKSIMLQVAEHEIDEALFRSGLRDDPHYADGTLKRKIA